MKKILAFLCALAMVVTAIPVASATDVPAIQNAHTVDHIVQLPGTRGVNKPVEEHDLNEEAYTGEFYNVSAGVYTNKYFTNVSLLVVYFSSLTTDTEDTTFEYSVTDLTTPTTPIVKSLRLTPGTTTRTYGFPFGPLNPTHKYCVFMRTVDADTRASGKITVKLN